MDSTVRTTHLAAVHSRQRQIRRGEDAGGGRAGLPCTFAYRIRHFLFGFETREKAALDQPLALHSSTRSLASNALSTLAMPSTPGALELALLADEMPSAGSVPCGAQSLPPPSATSPSRSRSRHLRLPDNHSSSSRSLSLSQSNSPHHHDNNNSSSVFYLHPDTLSQLRQRSIQIQVVDQRFKHPSWMHPNVGGESQHVHASPADVAALRDRRSRFQPNLREWPATAISGNAILSSVLFSAGLTAAKAGRFAPLAQLAVIVTVYCFRFVLADVMSAVPLNGGCYTAVLNASTKKTAAVAATFSVLSYLATGVVCAVSGLTYARPVYDPLPVVACAVALLLAVRTALPPRHCGERCRSTRTL